MAELEVKIIDPNKSDETCLTAIDEAQCKM